MSELEYDAATLIAKYLELRDTKEKIAEQHKLELSPYNDALETIENALLKIMLDTKVDSLPVRDLGTAYQQRVLSVKCADRGAFHAFVFKHHAGEYLTAHVSKDAVNTYMEENEGRLPPGIEARWYTNVNVMRKS